MRLADAADAATYGGKAASLAKAKRAGLPVPDGIALSTRDVAALLADDEAAMSRLRAQLEQLSRPVAVRSSAVGEDAPEHSFAGQHVTTLNVHGWAEVRAAVEDVHASASSSGMLAYRRRHGISDVLHVAVLVQEMVPAEVSGVMFTRDPASGEDIRVIEATWGLGEAVVAGLVIPDHFRIAPDGVLLASDVGEKDVEVVACADGGVEQRPVPAARAERSCLDADHLAQLAQLADACEHLLGAGQDVEWAFAAGELKLLQSRPITTSRGPARSDRD